MEKVQQPSGIKTNKQLKVKQLLVAPFQALGSSLTYSVLALSEDGAVYRYDTKCKGWLPWSMDIATCIDEHAGGR